MMNDTCKHGIYPTQSCSYCSGRRTKSDFSGISGEDVYTHISKPMGLRLPHNTKGNCEEFDQDWDLIKTNLGWD